jgi:hypothetical protein
MEFHGKFHGIQWNSMEFHRIPLNFLWNSMEFSMEFHGIMKLRLMEFHGKFHGIPWNSSIDGIRWNSVLTGGGGGRQEGLRKVGLGGCWA